MARRYNLSSLPPSVPTQQPFTRIVQAHERREFKEDTVHERFENVFVLIIRTSID